MEPGHVDRSGETATRIDVKLNHYDATALGWAYPLTPALSPKGARENHSAPLENFSR